MYSRVVMGESEMKIPNIETSRLILRGFTKEDALWAYSIWNNPEMGQYLPDEAKEEIDNEYLKMLEGLGEDEECCYLIPVFKDSLERVGTCSFMISEDKKVYDIAYCVHKKFWCQAHKFILIKLFALVRHQLYHIFLFSIPLDI